MGFWSGVAIGALGGLAVGGFIVVLYFAKNFRPFR